jgi:hypothetical protein
MELSRPAQQAVAEEADNHGMSPVDALAVGANHLIRYASHESKCAILSRQAQ